MATGETPQAVTAVLFAIIADDKTVTVELRAPWLLPPAFAASLAVFLAIYYASHALLFNTSIL